MPNSNFWTQPKSLLDFVTTLLMARWRSLFLLLLGIAVPLLVFEQLAIAIWQNKSVLPWDEPILLVIHQTVSPQLDAFAMRLTTFGVYQGVFPAATSVGIALLYWRRWRSLTYWLVTLLGSVTINRTAKILLHRVRPKLWDSIAPELDYGFPSGHAMSSMSFVVALVILTWRTRWYWPVLLSGSLFVLAIGWTRLYLGVHFPSDVLAGWMVSLAWAIGVSLVIRPHLAKPSLVSEEALTVGEEKAAEMEQV